MEFKPIQRAAMRTLAKAIEQVIDATKEDVMLKEHLETNYPIKLYQLKAYSLLLKSDLDEVE